MPTLSRGFTGAFFVIAAAFVAVLIAHMAATGRLSHCASSLEKRFESKGRILLAAAGAVAVLYLAGHLAMLILPFFLGYGDMTELEWGEVLMGLLLFLVGGLGPFVMILLASCLVEAMLLSSGLTRCRSNASGEVS